jgi:ADP-ribose pyrophosphatase
MGVENMFPKRLARTVIYENPWVNLYVDKVIFPDGRLIEKHHYLHYDRQSVGIVVENNKNEILLIKSYRYVTNSMGWEIPAGGIEDGETPQEAAKREVLEETGYTVTEPQLIYTFNPSNGMSDAVFNIVRCKAISCIDEFDKNEVKERKWESIRNIREMIGNNEIKCGPSLIGLLLTLSEIEVTQNDN